MAGLGPRPRDAGRRREVVLGNFANAKFTYAGMTSTFSRRDGKFFVRTDGPDGKLADFEIKYTFGVRPLQQYLIELPGGRLQALSSPGTRARRRKAASAGSTSIRARTSRPATRCTGPACSQNWNFLCAECHSTDLRKNYDATTGTFKTTWSEINVVLRGLPRPRLEPRRLGEASRADWQALDASKGLARRARRAQGRGLDAGRRRPATRSAARRARRRARSRPARAATRARSRISDDYVHGKPPLDTHRLALLDDGLYWNDGQMRDEVYNYGSFLQSRMYAQGVTCSRLPRSAFAQAARARQRRVRAVPPAGEVRHRAAHAPRRGHARRRVRGLPHADDDLHGGRSAPRSLAAHSAARSLGEARHAERLQRTATRSKPPQWAADAIAKWTGKPPAATRISPRRCTRARRARRGARRAAAR